MYGIPNMKLDKGKVERRINLLEEEGIEFVCNAEIGKNVNVETIRNANDAWCCVRVRPYRETTRTGRRQGHPLRHGVPDQKPEAPDDDARRHARGRMGEHITAEGKDVIVIGGGDTGTDCIGTSMRHRCKSIVNFELGAAAGRARTRPVARVARRGVDYGHGEVQAVFGQDPREYGVITTEFW